MNKELKTILSIDDEDDIRTISSMILKKKGRYNVISKNSGKAALLTLNELNEEDLPDLILLDVMMPDMDGPQTLEKVKTSPPPIADIPIIFLTAKCQPDEVKRLMELGAIGVIAKPFDPNALAQEVQNLWNSIQG